MTNEEIGALKPGVPLDDLVCAAIGRITANAFSPSRDWRDAMHAADSAKLFESEWLPPKNGDDCIRFFHRFITKANVDLWKVCEWQFYSSNSTGIGSKSLGNECLTTVASGETGPLAISRAILIVKPPLTAHIDGEYDING